MKILRTLFSMGYLALVGAAAGCRETPSQTNKDLVLERQLQRDNEQEVRDKIERAGLSYTLWQSDDRKKEITQQEQKIKFLTFYLDRCRDELHHLEVARQRNEPAVTRKRELVRQVESDLACEKRVLRELNRQGALEPEIHAQFETDLEYVSERERNHYK